MGETPAHRTVMNHGTFLTTPDPALVSASRPGHHADIAHWVGLLKILSFIFESLLLAFGYV